MPHNIALFLQIAPTLSSAKSLAQHGALVINGRISTDLGVFIKPGDTIQIVPKLWNLVTRFYNFKQWSYLKIKLTYISFLQVDWSMHLFSLVHWPQAHQLIPTSFLSER